LADHDRPLAARGRRASKLIAEHLRSNSIVPTLVLCSSAARARETLERIEPAVGTPQTLIEDRLYGASATELLVRLREVPEGTASVLLIGHQPSLQELALGLAADGAELPRIRGKFPTAALATLLFAGEWSELRSGCAEAVGFVKPKELRE
jgi:phosphohistidine phosphatase